METVGSTQWMSLADVIKETGLSRCTVYAAANEGKLPVPTYRFGRRILVSRQQWDALKESQNSGADKGAEPISIDDGE